jgi:hypothetical protein
VNGQYQSNREALPSFERAWVESLGEHLVPAIDGVE